MQQYLLTYHSIHTVYSNPISTNALRVEYTVGLTNHALPLCTIDTNKYLGDFENPKLCME